MGQRIQLIVVMPKVYHNDGNPNNKPKRVLVYHNQWLYGYSFLRYITKLMAALRYYAADENRPSWSKSSKDQAYHMANRLDSAINYANYCELGWETNTHPYSEKGEDCNAKLAELSVQDFLDWFDNNNGYIFVEIDRNAKAKFDIINGTEDDENVKRRTPQQYLDLFYEKGKQDAEMLATVNELDGLERTNAFARLEILKEEIAKGDAK